VPHGYLCSSKLTIPHRQQHSQTRTQVRVMQHRHVPAAWATTTAFAMTAAAGFTVGSCSRGLGAMIPAVAASPDTRDTSLKCNQNMRPKFSRAQPAQQTPTSQTSHVPGVIGFANVCNSACCAASCSARCTHNLTCSARAARCKHSVHARTRKDVTSTSTT
jgi:hypothetical protein